MNDTADIVIIGGGVIGTSLAFHLARRGYGKIVLLEKETLGCGSSGLSVAAIDLFSLYPPAAELHARSIPWFKEFEERVGETCDYVKTGFAAIGGEGDVQAIQAAVKIGIEAGIDLRLCDPAEYGALDPGAEFHDISLVGYAPDGGYADPAMTTTSFANAAKRMGAEIRQGAEVIGIKREGGKISGVITNSGEIDAPEVVVAAGPWSGKILQWIDYEDPGLVPYRVPIAVVRRPADFEAAPLSIIDLINSIWTRPESGHLTLVGSVDRKYGYDKIAPDGNPGAVSDEYTFWSVERLVNRYPILERSEILPGWAGSILTVPDRQPLLGALPETPGFYFATGLSGQGFKISPAVGDLVAGLIAGEEEATELLVPFRPTRFAEGKPITSELKTGTLG